MIYNYFFKIYYISEKYNECFVENSNYLFDYFLYNTIISLYSFLFNTEIFLAIKRFIKIDRIQIIEYKYKNTNTHN